MLGTDNTQLKDDRTKTLTLPVDEPEASTQGLALTHEKPQNDDFFWSDHF
jgi:hypothetical protein